MKMVEPVSGFSKWTKAEKISWLEKQKLIDVDDLSLLDNSLLNQKEHQQIVDDLSENVLSNFSLPFSVAPNFLVDGEMKVFPLVTEESSVVASLAKAAGFWAKRGGFHTTLIGTEKRGQLHFFWNGNPEKLQRAFPVLQQKMDEWAHPLVEKMISRGGGVRSSELNYLPHILPSYYQIDVVFDTCDAMGANLINSCLERFRNELPLWFSRHENFQEQERQIDVLMAILSNYTPNSRVVASVSCPVAALDENGDFDAASRLANRFVQAVHVARMDVSRAVTHNKGILNGIDAFALATGNDFRAIEAGAHAFAARSGQYRSLSKARVDGGRFYFSLELPLAVGVVGGVTSVHPMPRLASKILGSPSAPQLMQYMAVTGLASNWSAVLALTTTGIQKGHMKMHLSNILNQLSASDEQKEAAFRYFERRTVSFSDVGHFLKELWKYPENW